MRTLNRAQGPGVVAAGVLAAVVMWGILRMAGVDLEAGRGEDRDTVGLGAFLVAAVIAGLAAWAVHAFLVRTAHAGWWPFIGSTALAISIIGPSWLAPAESAVALIAVHVVVAAILIAGFAMLDRREPSNQPLRGQGFGRPSERRG